MKAALARRGSWQGWCQTARCYGGFIGQQGKVASRGKEKKGRICTALSSTGILEGAD